MGVVAACASTWTFIKPSQCELVFFFTFQLLGEVSGEVERRVSRVLLRGPLLSPQALRWRQVNGARWCSQAGAGALVNRARLSARALG